MRDLIGHDQKPAAYLVYLHLYGQAARSKWRPISASVRTISDATGFSKSAAHAALTHLRRRQLIATSAESRHRYSAPSSSSSLARGSLEQSGAHKSMNANAPAIPNRL